MTNEPNTHPVYKSINRELTIWGAERRLFFLALIMGAATFNFFASLVGGIVMFLGLYLLARWATVHDTQMLRVLLNSSKFRTHYDPFQRDTFRVQRTGVRW
ncbi:MAG TPA: VirB3 family type IV secretion system protein [Bryobacteraceae bacterium]|nr:VirB3 family type IV secretion system protein [Bryobacteraceae bacterium]